MRINFCSLPLNCTSILLHDTASFMSQHSTYHVLCNPSAEWYKSVPSTMCQVQDGSFLIKSSVCNANNIWYILSTAVNGIDTGCSMKMCTIFRNTHVAQCKQNTFYEGSRGYSPAREILLPKCQEIKGIARFLHLSQTCFYVTFHFVYNWDIRLAPVTQHINQWKYHLYQLNNWLKIQATVE